MPNTSIRFLVPLILLCSCMTSAQELNINELPVTLQALLERSGRDNLIELVQQGTANQGLLFQSGSDNKADVTQVGNDNDALITQIGSNNEVQLLQVGSQNTASVTQIGNDNLVQLNQLGSGNFSIQQIADGAAISITQY